MHPSTPAKRLPYRHLRRTAALWLALTAAACSDVVPAFGPDAATARTNASQFFGGLGWSFSPATYDAKYTRARERFSANFLSPSALHADTSLWSANGQAAAGDVERVLHSRALFTGSGYHQTSLPVAAPLPTALGESRHRMSLTARGDGRYSWDARVEWALGPGRAETFERLPGVLALSAARYPKPHEAWERDAPKAVTAIVPLVTVDTARADRARDGTSLVTYAVRLTPDRGRAQYPALAGFFEKYIARSSFDVQLSDARGARWLETSAINGVLRLRLRVAPGGTLVPLTGAGTSLPDSLRLTGSIYARGGWAGVRIDRIVADVLLERAGPRRGFTLKWRTEPIWGFPFSVDRLIPASLRTPFEGDGVVVSFALEDGPQGQLLLVRRFAGTVQESRLVRWMGSLAGSVFGAWTGAVEPDANRWLAASFSAIAADVRAQP